MISHLYRKLTQPISASEIRLKMLEETQRLLLGAECDVEHAVATRDMYLQRLLRLEGDLK